MGKKSSCFYANMKLKHILHSLVKAYTIRDCFNKIHDSCKTKFKFIFCFVNQLNTTCQLISEEQYKIKLKNNTLAAFKSDCSREFHDFLVV